MNQSDELRGALAEAIECIGNFVDVHGNEWHDGTPLNDKYEQWEAVLAADRQAAESPGPVTEMGMCEIPWLILHAEQLYRFHVMPNCQKCLDYLNPPERSLAEVSADENGMLPCPFCGGEAYKTESVNGSNMVYVGCSPCGIAFKAQKDCTNGILTKDIVAAWNQRKGTFSLRASGTDNPWKQYAQHRDSCAAPVAGPKACNCGLSQLRAAPEAGAKEGESK